MWEFGLDIERTEPKHYMKRLLSFTAIVFLLSSCSDCYECSRYDRIEDVSGNVIDSTLVTNEICTATESDLDDWEADGYTCDR